VCAIISNQPPAGGGKGFHKRRNAPSFQKSVFRNQFSVFSFQKSVFSFQKSACCLNQPEPPPGSVPMAFRRVSPAAEN
jgi:hypothetical protein